MNVPMFPVSSAKRKPFPVERLIALGFLIGFSALVYWFNYSGNPGSGAILGEHTEDPILTLKNGTGFKSINEQVGQAVDRVLDRSGSYVKDTADRSVSSIKETVFVKTVDKITEQIDKLPQDQKDEVKDRICR